MLSSIIWPITIIIIILMFKDQMRFLLEALANVGNKAQKLQYRNFSIDLEGTKSGFLKHQEEHASVQHLQYLKAFQSDVVTSEERLIRSQLIESKMTQEQILNVLIYHLANANLLIKLLKIDRLIFKEQVDLLRHLNSQIKPLSESELECFYDQWKESLKNETEYTVEGFLNFLSQERMIIPGVDGYSIGPIGKEYLGFLIRIGRGI